MATGGSAPAEILDAAEFASLKREQEVDDERRETVIKRSRDVVKLSKHAIFATHRGDHDKADSLLAQARRAAEELLPLVTESPGLRAGTFSAGLEEFAEASIFHHFVRTGRVLSRGALPLASREEYIGGLLDFTGELNRFAVLLATARKDIRSCVDVVEAIAEQMAGFDWRNTGLRRKFDTLKYTLRKLELLRYDMTVGAGRLAPELAVEDGGERPAAATAGTAGEES